MKARRLARLIGCRAMASLAANTQFGGHDCFISVDAELARGMTREAAQDRGGWIEDAVPNTAGTRMPRRAGICTGRAVPGFAFFQVGFRVQSPDKGDSLLARSKCPVAWLGGLECARARACALLD